MGSNVVDGDDIVCEFFSWLQLKMGFPRHSGYLSSLHQSFVLQAAAGESPETKNLVENSYYKLLVIRSLVNSVVSLPIKHDFTHSFQVWVSCVEMYCVQNLEVRKVVMFSRSCVPLYFWLRQFRMFYFSELVRSVSSSSSANTKDAADAVQASHTLCSYKFHRKEDGRSGPQSFCMFQQTC